MNLIRDIDFSDKAQAKSDIEKIKKLYFIHFTSKKVKEPYKLCNLYNLSQ